MIGEAPCQAGFRVICPLAGIQSFTVLQLSRFR